MPVAVAATSSPSQASSLQVWSFNLRTEFQETTDGLDGWSKRRDGVVDLILQRRPAIVCTQEATEAMLSFLVEGLGESEYAWLGTSRSTNSADETAGLLFDRRRLKLLHADTAWFGPPGSRSGMPGWDAELPRTMESAVFQLCSGGSRDDVRLQVVNAHFDHVGVDARLQSARQLAVALNAGVKAWPGVAQIVCGDFNSPKGRNGAYEALLSGGFQDTARVANLVGSTPKSTIHKFRGGTFSSDHGDGTVVLAASGCSGESHNSEPWDAAHIDWILWRDGPNTRLSPLQYEVVTDKLPSGRYPSDHYPVSCMFELLGNLPLAKL